MQGNKMSVAMFKLGTMAGIRYPWLSGLRKGSETEAEFFNL